MKILVVVFLCAAFSSVASAGLCEQESANRMRAGREVLSCKEVDFGVRAISADYQKRQTEPVSIYPDRVKSRERDGGASRFAINHLQTMIQRQGCV